MKKSYLIMAAIASLALVSCSDEEFTGNPELGPGQGTGEINFGLIGKGMTRADLYGADAAAKLGELFVVEGTKTVTVNSTSTTSTVFDNYYVKWGANTAGTTTDNTSDWKYVGLTIGTGTGQYPQLGSISGDQTIKYWDWSADYYNFAAFSAGTNTIINSGTPNTDQILATKIDYEKFGSNNPAYSLTGSVADLQECYITDIITAVKPTATSPDVEYNKEVTFKFRNLGSKVRIALYETIPGYSVRDVKFYTVDGGSTPNDLGATSTNATLFSSGNAFPTYGTMNVTFPTIGTANRSLADYNKAHVSFTAVTEGSNQTSYETTKSFGNLQYETDYTKWEDSRLRYSETEVNTNKYLKRTSSDPSFAGTTDPYYLLVLPDETGKVLELRVDYTLESIDGSKETITVHGAKAFVPQIYAQWLPNYAYTYIFKISDNTNGWTSKTSSDPAGLYPITFDAVVLNSEEKTQSTITTVSMPSITTYMKGHDYAHDGPEYKASASDSIYIQVMNGTTLASDLNTNGYFYTVSKANATEAEVMDALNVRTSGEATTIDGRNGITLTPSTIANAADGATPPFRSVPGTDGNQIKVEVNTAARFLASAGTYAYVYYTGTNKADSYIYSAEKSETKPTDWTTTDTWYKDPNGANAVVDADWVANKYFYKRYTNDNKVYAVKIIKVQ